MCNVTTYIYLSSVLYLQILKKGSSTLECFQFGCNFKHLNYVTRAVETTYPGSLRTYMNHKNAF